MEDVENIGVRNHKTIKRLVLFKSLLLIVLAFVFWKEFYVNAFLLCISKEEKRQLETAFFFLNNYGCFPWVVKGIKPLATFDELMHIEWDLDNPILGPIERWNRIFLSIYPVNVQIDAGIKVWNKYSHFFSSKNIKILEGTSSFFYDWNNRSILLLNVEATRKIIEKNYKIFESVLGKSFNIDVFMNQLIKYPGDFEKHVKESHYLKGILYGYGTENALHYQIMQEPYTFSIPPYNISYQSNKKCKPLGSFLNQCTPADPQNHALSCPGFRVDPTSKETLELKKNYLENFQKINKEMKKSSVLKWSLCQLLSQ